MELDEERSAAAVAANNAMAMITRLQAEKAGVHMEALQYQRMMDEQAEYDEEAIQILRDLYFKKEEDVKVLEDELDVYRARYGELKRFGSDEYDFDDDEYYDELESRSYVERNESGGHVDDGAHRKGHHEHSSANFETERRQLFGMLRDFEDYYVRTTAQEDRHHRHMGGKGGNVKLLREVSLLMDKLAAMEAESGFLKHAALTLEKGEEGTKVVSEELVAVMFTHQCTIATPRPFSAIVRPQPPPRSAYAPPRSAPMATQDHHLEAVFTQKRVLRTKIKKDLRSMDPDLRSREDDAIQKLILEAPWFKSCKGLCAYISCSALREVDTSKVLQGVLQNPNKDGETQTKKKLYVPRVEDKNSHMRMLNISGMDDLIANSMNILEPAPVDANGNDREDVMLANEPVDLLLLPGLAFDKTGRRMGRGGGYYDTFLSKYQELARQRNWKQPLLIALSYSVQILEEGVIPVTPSDVFYRCACVPFWFHPYQPCCPTDLTLLVGCLTEICSVLIIKRILKEDLLKTMDFVFQKKKRHLLSIC
ncbi:hypothetical protein OSB04_005359 [Centaurea solstitialis]|uniref:5-formyltetrahydrofolate cyclo-ligase n=1 Tax=Centaurea solstitialis TaxID=347529 RepID=A0AA38THM6_9ASTR|nr:hypothetical protein OSB04_005359 [Centaurea solstitialis]